LRLSGVAVVDRVIGGIAPGLPLVLAGPPGCGRTVLALQIAEAALRENDIVAFLSSEPAPLLLRQAHTLGLDLEPAVRNGQLLLLELDPGAPAALAATGGRTLVEAILAEHPSVSLIAIDPLTSLTTEILDEAPLRAMARDLVAATPRATLVLTVETERPVLDAPIERALAEICGSFLTLARRRDGRRTLAVEKTRAGAGPAEAVEFEIGAEGARLVRDIPLADAAAAAEPEVRAARDAESTPAARREPVALAVGAPAPRETPLRATRDAPLRLHRGPREAPPAEAPRREPRARPRVLLIDDDEAARAQFGGWLAERYELVVARDGFQGVAKLLGERPDLILLDLVLPRVSGFEVIAALHQANAAIPLLVVTSRLERLGDRLGPLVLGACDVLAKPVDRFELLHKIETALRLEAPLRPEVDPVEAGALFAPSGTTRVVSPGEFRERLARACEFGSRFDTPSTLVAFEAQSGELIDRLAAGADRALRLEDAFLVMGKRRAVALLVAASPAQARPATARLMRAAFEAAPPRLRAAFAQAAAGEDFEPLFERLEPLDLPPPAGGGA
jgi:CheY-like chemotaxis protein